MSLSKIFLLVKPKLERIFDSTQHENNLKVIGRALKFLSLKYLEEVSTQDIAEHCHLSQSRLRAIFSQILGVSPIDYRNQLRIDHVAQKMMNSDEKLSQIALQAGFDSYTHFARLFRRKMGISPREARRNPGSLWKALKPI